MDQEQTQGVVWGVILALICFGFAAYGFADIHNLTSLSGLVFGTLNEVGGQWAVIGFLLLAGAGFSLMAIRSVRPTTYDKKTFKPTATDRTMGSDVLHNDPNANLPLHIRYVLGVGAQLSAFSGSFLNSIATGKDKAMLKSGLEHMWGIASREDFLELAEHLAQFPNKGPYEGMWQGVLGYVHNPPPGNITNAVFGATIPPPQLTEAINKVAAARPDIDFAANPNAYTEWTTRILHSRDWVGLMRANGVAVDTVSNLAVWDAGRLINVCRWCVDLGWVSEAEMIALCLPVAQAVQQSYGSWKMLADAYIVASMIWGAEQFGGSDDQDDLTERLNSFMRTYRMLAADPTSPFLTVPWNTPLA